MNRVAAAAEVHSAATEMAQQLLAGPAIAIRAANQAVHRGRQVDLGTELDLGNALFIGPLATEDTAIGMCSLLGRVKAGKAQLRGR